MRYPLTPLGLRKPLGPHFWALHHMIDGTDQGFVGLRHLKVIPLVSCLRKSPITPPFTPHKNLPSPLFQKPALSSSKGAVRIARRKSPFEQRRTKGIRVRFELSSFGLFKRASQTSHELTQADKEIAR